MYTYGIHGYMYMYRYGIHGYMYMYTYSIHGYMHMYTYSIHSYMCMYTHNWFTLLYSRNQYSIVRQLSSNKKKIYSVKLKVSVSPGSEHKWKRPAVDF